MTHNGESEVHPLTLYPVATHRSYPVSASQWCREMKVIEAFSWMLFVVYAFAFIILICLVSRAQAFGRLEIWSEPIRGECILAWCLSLHLIFALPEQSCLGLAKLLGTTIRAWRECLKLHIWLNTLILNISRRGPMLYNQVSMDRCPRSARYLLHNMHENPNCVGISWLLRFI